MQHALRLPCVKKLIAKKKRKSAQRTSLCGGDEGTRTPGPHVANVMLYQLSYIPIQVKRHLAILNIRVRFVK